MATFGSTINGTPVKIDVEGPESAVDVLRGQLGLTGTKLVCAGGVCGACTVTIDGEPAASCLTPATALRDAEVTTVEGLADGEELHPVQRAFVAHDAVQCGYCTPGFVVDAVSFVDRWRADNGDTEPDRHTIADALAGHLCRCGTYEGIYRAVAAACRGEHDADDEALANGRVDGRAKVTGAAVFTADRLPEGALEAVIVRSPVGAAVVGPFPSDAHRWAVDLLGEHRRTTWAGQPVAAVAAESIDEARRLAAEFPIEFTPQPFVVDPEAAKADDAPLVYADKEARGNAPNAAEGASSPARWSGNRRGPVTIPLGGTIAKRRFAKARKENDPGLVELSVGTGVQLHTAFEPHCAVADFTDPKRLIVWASTQAVDMVHEELAEHFGLEADQVEVRADFVGGGFGAKVFPSIDITAAAELSKVAGRPVRLVLDRREELTATGNRPGSSTKISLLTDGERNRGIVVEGEAHTGAAINGAYALLPMMMYGKSARSAHDFDIVTNTPPGCAFRGPGGPTAAWPLESAVDQLAHQLGKDPIELRLSLDGHPRRQALYRWARELDVWKGRPVTGSQTGRFQRGVGIAGANWMYMYDPNTEITVGVDDGRLYATTGTQDMGTGSKTVIARAVAAAFDVAIADVDVRLGTASGSVPHGPPSGGSRTTPSIYPAAFAAAEALKAEIGPEPTAAHNGKSASSTRGRDPGRRPVPFMITGIQIGRQFQAALHISEVEVDTRTGKTRVLSVHGGLAVGVIHAPDQARSQCEGSIIQGIGLALYEQQVIDPHTGLTLTSNLEDYRIPQLGDTPEITMHFHEEGWDHVPGGGVGLGEVATISPAASVGNAIFNATGWRPTHLPIRPDRVLEGLR